MGERGGKEGEGRERRETKEREEEKKRKMGKPILTKSEQIGFILKKKVQQVVQ